MVRLQAFIQSGISSVVDQRSLAGFQQGFGADVTSPSLPPNLRLISNYFRTGPDGTVRAFSNPVVHERLLRLFIC